MRMQSTSKGKGADHKLFIKVWHLPTTCIGEVVHKVTPELILEESTVCDLQAQFTN